MSRFANHIETDVGIRTHREMPLEVSRGVRLQKASDQYEGIMGSNFQPNQSLTVTHPELTRLGALSGRMRWHKFQGDDERGRVPHQTR